jgi:cleavage stimulation factor subunit 3
MSVLSLHREYYESFLKQFPTSGRYWKYYAENELSFGHVDQVQSIMQRCLLKCPNIELYKFYIQYMLDTKYKPVIATNPPDSEPVVKARTEMITAFDFVLQQVGIDLNSNEIWFEYIKFLWHDYGSDKNPFTKMQKESLLRDRYKRALQTPMGQLDTLFWKEYENFEATVNPTKAVRLSLCQLYIHTYIYIYVCIYALYV